MAAATSDATPMVTAMWIDRVRDASEPVEIALALLATSSEEMALTERIDAEELTSLSERLVALMLGFAVFRGVQVPEESEWPGFLGTRDHPAYAPAVMAGAVGLSHAIAAVIRADSLGARALLEATTALDRLPHKPDFAALDKTNDEFITAYNVYRLVPPVFELRLAWAMLAWWRSTPAGLPADGEAAEAFRHVWERLSSDGWGEPLDPANLLRGIVMRQLAPFVDPIAGPTAMRSLDFSELPTLAALAPSAIARHRTRQGAAHVFQQRLTALMRSFGGRVVAAAPGEPLGDLYYELSDGEFLLLDAKSVGNQSGYELPSSDRDAIRRYVAQARRLLPAGRCVRAVLIVGPRAAVTLEQRLSKLEVDVGCDVRFATAAQMVLFREAHPGGELAGTLETLHRQPHVLLDGWWNPIVEQSIAENARLERYVRDGLGR